MIGRREELAELEAALADAADGRPALAFLAGESGVGKTRLLSELTRRARDGGALVLVGEAVDLGGDGELPYLPLVAALRPLERAGDPALTGRVREAVAPLLPGTAPDPGGDQARLFEGLLSLLDALGRERPVLLVIEDLHWADGSTRAAVAFLARSLRDERVLLVASYRPDELQRKDPLRSLLAELERAPRARRVTLAPLTRDELAEQLADILDAAPGDEQLERLWTRSGGNPLFAEELLAAGLDGRGLASRTLRDALMLRVERLSGSARDVLALVAVGERIDDELLAETSGLEPRALRDALRETVDRHIVVVDDDGRYRFRHALLRELVEADLLPGERRELHRTLARALERHVDDGAQAAAAVAYHYEASGDEPAALAAALRAAAAAERVHAYGEAVALFERALALSERVPDSGIDRVDVLARAGAAAGLIGDPARQLALLRAAFAGLGPRPDQLRAARILESTARAQRHLNHAPESIATLERALALVQDDALGRAELLAALGRARMLVAQFGEAIRVAREALAAADGLPLVEGHARNTLGYSLAMTGDVDAGTGELRESIRIAREHDDLSDLGEAYNNCAEMLHAFGRSGEARAVALEGRQAIAGRKPVAVTWLDTRLAEIAFDAGEWELADEILPAPQRWTGTQTLGQIELRAALLALGRGDHPAAAALLRELEPIAAESSEPRAVANISAASAELHRREGELAAASAAVERRLDRCAADAIGRSLLACEGVTVAADAAQRARDLGDAEAAAAELRRAEELLARVAETGPVEAATRLGARAEAARAAGRPDPAGYGHAAAAWEALGRPEPAARMRWRAAEALVATGDREAAAAAARDAYATALRLGAGWLREEIESLAARARLALEPEPAEAAEPAEDDDAFGLTQRERQVLALVAEGATNREIGAALFMAQKTASVHVSRILAKLNVRSRTEAAAVAHRHGLAD